MSGAFTPPTGMHERESVAGWGAWRAGRGSFTPAPMLRIGQYRSLGQRERML